MLEFRVSEQALLPTGLPQPYPLPPGAPQLFLLYHYVESVVAPLSSLSLRVCGSGGLEAHVEPPTAVAASEL